MKVLEQQLEQEHEERINFLRERHELEGKIMGLQVIMMTTMMATMMATMMDDGNFDGNNEDDGNDDDDGNDEDGKGRGTSSSERSWGSR